MQTGVSEYLYHVCMIRACELAHQHKTLLDSIQLRVLAYYCWNAGHSLGDQI
jgi:hypothetical protein